MTMGLSWGWLRGVFSGLRTNRRKARSHRVTGLEDRTMLAAFVVNTLLDTVDANPGDGLALVRTETHRSARRLLKPMLWLGRIRSPWGPGITCSRSQSLRESSG
jgi:hypothetical protein